MAIFIIKKIFMIHKNYFILDEESTEGGGLRIKSLLERTVLIPMSLLGNEIINIITNPFF